MFKKITTHLFIAGIFLFFSFSILKAQETESSVSRWYITSGFGYYSPPGDRESKGSGCILYSEIGYQLSSGYNIGVGFGLSHVVTEYEESLLEGLRTSTNYYIIRLFINRAFQFGANDNQQIKIGSGIIRIQPRFSRLRVTLRPVYDNQGNIINEELVISQFVSNRNSVEVGFPFTFEYGYSFGSLTIGARAELHLLFAGGISSYIISPQISLDL